MAKVVVLGAGVAGHTAASFLKKKLGKHHEVVVVTPNSYYQWIPSNIWVGVGQMTIDDVRFELKKVVEKIGMDGAQKLMSDLGFANVSVVKVDADREKFLAAIDAALWEG